MKRYGGQLIDNSDIEEVVSVLQSDFLTQGPKVKEFELGILKETNSVFASAVNTGTAALHLACLSLGLSQDDIVWTVPNSFVASATCALACGAIIDFVDIQVPSLNICISSLEKKLILSKKNSCLPKILIVVHFGGNPCDLENIRRLSLLYDFQVIEDASHALGATFKDSNIGSCKYSDATTFSFHPVKIITTGEGGVVTSNDQLIYEKINLYRSHGISKDTSRFSNNVKESYYYEQVVLGWNYRMSDIHAALGVSQLKKLRTFVARRNEIAERYLQKLAHLPLDFQAIQRDSTSSYHLFIIMLENRTIRDDLYRYLVAKNIGVQVHYIPIHTHPFFKEQGFSVGMFPNAEKYFDKTITIPLHPGLTEKDQDFIVKKIDNFFKQ